LNQITAGETLIDLTGGFGIDSYFFSKKIKAVTHCEMHVNLSQIATYNFDILGVKNVQFIAEDGLSYLENSVVNFDWIYIDPSRRNSTQNRVFKLSDCTPNVPEKLEVIFKKSNRVLLKTSPLLDISLGLKALKFVREIHCVSVNNDMKELLWVLHKNYTGMVQLKTVNFKKQETDVFNFKRPEEKAATSNFSVPLRYLYEPNAAILKAGGFKVIGNKFHVQKLHENTHLYTSNELLDFPGRTFEIKKVIPYQKTHFKSLLNTKANVAIRNFPYSVATLRKKLKIKDGGNNYLFFTTTRDQMKCILHCAKINPGNSI